MSQRAPDPLPPESIDPPEGAGDDEIPGLLPWGEDAGSGGEGDVADQIAALWDAIGQLQARLDESIQLG